MEISGKGLLHFDQETSFLISNQTYHRTNMFSPYQSNSCYESDYECVCIMINCKTCSVPLNIFSSVYIYMVLGCIVGELLHIISHRCQNRGQNVVLWTNGKGIVPYMFIVDDVVYVL